MPQTSATKIKKIKAKQKANKKKCEEKSLRLINAIVENPLFVLEDYTEEEIIEAIKEAKQYIKIIE